MKKTNAAAQRIKALREKMKENHVEWYLIPTADYHDSEYVNDYFKVREFFSGFTGSNGTLLVGMEEAGLWTDGRYFIQAEQQLQGSGIRLFKMGEEGVPSLKEYLFNHIQREETLGLDGRVISASLGKSFKEELGKKGAHMESKLSLESALWKDRPPLPHNKAFLLEDTISGESAASKLKKVRMEMERLHADGCIISTLDDIMWLFNMRGRDVPCNLVALSYAWIARGKAVLFLQEGVLSKEQKEQLSKAAGEPVEVEAYDSFYEWLASDRKNEKVLLHLEHVNYRIYEILQKEKELLENENPATKLKAIKNPVEMKNLMEVYLQDSVAATKFIYWVKQAVKEQKLSEMDAACYMDNLRKEIPGFLDLSFETISAYRENAAMMHYTASAETAKTLEPSGLLLVDSGGQYMGGTTDVTRTISLGPVSRVQKEHYTAAMLGMCQLMNAQFLYGCTGRNLDILAREPLWNLHMDYKCGTGHGIGYMLNVHEGPQNIRWKQAPGNAEAILTEGMVVSDEPGVYIEGKYGIRIENILLCKKGVKNGDGQFLYFEPLTYVPLDRACIDVKLLSLKQLEWVESYQKKVYEKISPFLTKEEKQWLREETASFGKKESY